VTWGDRMMWHYYTFLRIYGREEVAVYLTVRAMNDWQAMGGGTELLSSVEA
jgi:hypothetical protein